MQHRDYVFRFAYFTKAQLWQFSPHSISSLENARKKTFGFYIALWKLHTQSQNTRLKDKYNAIPRHEEATHKISKLFPVLDICIVIVSSMFVLHHVQHDGNIFLLYVFQLFSLGSFYTPPLPSHAVVLLLLNIGAARIRQFYTFSLIVNDDNKTHTAHSHSHVKIGSFTRIKDNELKTNGTIWKCFEEEKATATTTHSTAAKTVNENYKVAVVCL